MHVDSGGRPTWRCDWQVGIRGCTYGTHSLGPVMQWFKAADPAERISAVTCLGTGQRTVPEHRNDDTTVMLCALASGKLIRVRLDMLSNRPHLANYYGLQGTLGAYEASRLEGQPGLVWIGENRHDGNRKWRPLSDFDEHLPRDFVELTEQARRAGHGGSDFHTARAFAQSILAGSPPPIGIHDALEWTAAGLCSQISIENGGAPIRVPDFRDPRQRPVTHKVAQPDSEPRAAERRVT
jgi:hypothetical protein